MARKLEWELSGKSDVPQKMAQAKSSMAGLEGASTALSKKFSESFKDIAVSFLAPVAIIHQAISLISQRIDKMKQDAKDARDFAKEEESKKYALAGGREAILQWMEKKDEEEKKKKGTDLATQGYKRFLKEDERGKALFEEYRKKNMPEATRESVALGTAQSMASYDPELRKKIDAILAPDIAARQAAEEAAAKAKANEAGPTAQKINELSSNVVGVGMTPQLDIATKQLSIQEDMANSLRTLIERDQAQSGFQTNKFYPTSRRLNISR